MDNRSVETGSDTAVDARADKATVSGDASLRPVDAAAFEEAFQRMAFMAAIVMSSDDAIISKDLNGVILSWNRAAERLYGYTEEEAVGNPVAMLIPPDHHDEEPEILARIRRGEVVDHYETVRIHKDGRMIDVSLTVSPVKDASGRIVGAAKIARDITERKEAEAALRESEQRFRTIADHAPVLIWINNRDECEFVNQTYLDFLGVGMEEIQGSGWTAFVHSDDLEGYLDAYRIATEAQAKFEGDFRFRRKDGEYRWMKAVGVPWIVGDGEFLGYIGSTVDITDRKRDESRLLQAQKLESMGVLAGGIAHDFNNLLTGILGASNLLAETKDMPEGATSLLNGISSACMRAADLTRQILAYSGKGRFIIEPIDVSDLTHEITELLRASVPKNVFINESFTDEPYHVLGDKGQLQQIIMNLVLNATESLDGEAGSVWISTSIDVVDARVKSAYMPVEAEPGTYLAFRVKDEGIGMDEETISRIFDPFFSTKSKGRGLGLSAVLGIVRGHKGGLRVKSSPGRGTTFEVLLPVQKDYVEPAPKEASPKHANLGDRRVTVLVVDDEQIIRTVVKGALEREGYAVLTAENGLQAVQTFKENSSEIDCVLLDLTMPVLNGDEALKRIREIRGNTPVIVMSGYSESEASSRFGDDSQLVFLQKPFSVAELKRQFDLILSWLG
ncbi:MAG: PAS domain S-box protein [Armatimonadota bacterium]|nr:PAS domain S-box protein [Armatimonadota bacterium]